MYPLYHTTETMGENPGGGGPEALLGTAPCLLSLYLSMLVGHQLEGLLVVGGVFGKRLRSREELINRSGKSESIAGQPGPVLPHSGYRFQPQ